MWRIVSAYGAAALDSDSSERFTVSMPRGAVLASEDLRGAVVVRVGTVDDRPDQPALLLAALDQPLACDPRR
jgi:hypothetical protein